MGGPDWKTRTGRVGGLSGFVLMADKKEGATVGQNGRLTRESITRSLTFRKNDDEIFVYRKYDKFPVDNRTWKTGELARSILFLFENPIGILDSKKKILLMKPNEKLN